MAHVEAREGVVDELLRERREEAQRDAEAHSGPSMTTEQFRARLKIRGERTLQRQAARRAAAEQDHEQARAA